MIRQKSVVVVLDVGSATIPANTTGIVSTFNARPAAWGHTLSFSSNISGKTLLYDTYYAANDYGTMSAYCYISVYYIENNTNSVGSVSNAEGSGYVCYAYNNS